MRLEIQTSTVCLGWILAATIGCATDRPPELITADSNYRAAASDRLVGLHAPVALQDSRSALDRAERAFDEGEDSAEVEHLAYVATQRVAIARALAEAEASRTSADRLEEKRDSMVLDARTQEAMDAREEAEQAKAELRDLQMELAELEARRTERGIVLTVGDVLFAVDRAELQPGAYSTLSRLATHLRKNPEPRVVIEGHTDATGSASHNDALSVDRARSVEQALEAQGVDPSRLSARGLGAAMPIASNGTEAGRQQNRRVEIVIEDAGYEGRVGAR